MVTQAGLDLTAEFSEMKEWESALSNIDLKETVAHSSPLLVSAIYDNEPLEELFGLFGKKKNKKSKNKGKSKKPSARSRDQKREKQGEDIDNAMGNAEKTSEITGDVAKEFIAACKNMVKKLGQSIIKKLALDALLASISGGIGVALKYLVKAFGGMNFVRKVLSVPMSKFAGQITDKKEELAIAEKGEEDPTAKNAKNEIFYRHRLSDLLL